jgi:hypothetical protein
VLGLLTHHDTATGVSLEQRLFACNEQCAVSDSEGVWLSQHQDDHNQRTLTRAAAHGQIVYVSDILLVVTIMLHAAAVAVV